MKRTISDNISPVSFGFFSLDIEKKILRFEENTVPLPLKAVEVLIFLAQNSRQVVTKEEILNNVWENTFVEESNLTHYIYLLRKTFKDLKQKNYIETVPRRGYQFVGNIEIEEDKKSNTDVLSESVLTTRGDDSDLDKELESSPFISSNLSIDELDERLHAFERSSSVFPEMVDVCNTLAERLRHHQVDLVRSLTLGNKANKLATELNYKQGQANALGQIGHTLIHLDRFAEAKQSLRLSISMFRKLGSQRGLALALNGLGIVLMRYGRYLEASEALKEAFNLAHEIEDNKSKTDTYEGIGELSYHLKDYDFAIEICRQGLAIENSYFSYGRFYDHLGLLYSLKGNSKKALENLNIALEEAEKVDDKYTIAKVYSHFAGMYNVTNEKQKALLYFEEARKIIEKLGLKDIQVLILEDMIDVYLEIKEYENALRQLEKMLEITKKGGNMYLHNRAGLKSSIAYFRSGNTEKAISILKKTWLKVKGNLGCDLPYKCQELFSEIYETQGDFQQALIHTKKYQEHKENCFVDRRKVAEMLSSVRTKLKSKRREKKILKEKDIEIAKAYDEIASQNDEIHISSSNNEELTKNLNSLKKLLPICEDCKEILEHPNYVDRLVGFFSNNPQKYSEGIVCICCEKTFVS